MTTTTTTTTVTFGGRIGNSFFCFDEFLKMFEIFFFQNDDVSNRTPANTKGGGVIIIISHK